MIPSQDDCFQQSQFKIKSKLSGFTAMTEKQQTYWMDGQMDLDLLTSRDASYEGRI